MVRKAGLIVNDGKELAVQTAISVERKLEKSYDFKNIFIETMIDILKDKSVPLKPQGLLTNGVQTSGNIFKHKKIVSKEILFALIL